jgi:phosphatidylserine/phosphatidylglycerophosphate/cardiolipin synthase-like enzyme
VGFEDWLALARPTGRLRAIEHGLQPLQPLVQGGSMGWGDRFRIFTPVKTGGAPIYVHAKITIVDKWLLRVGSS